MTPLWVSRASSGRQQLLESFLRNEFHLNPPVRRTLVFDAKFCVEQPSRNDIGCRSEDKETPPKFFQSPEALKSVFAGFAGRFAGFRYVLHALNGQNRLLCSSRL
jgi:hypothetical protein